MNFEDAVYAHSKWKARLKNHINGQEQIDDRSLASDDQCELGKWIYGDGKRHAALSAFEDLKAKHTKFHLVAASVVRGARSCSQDKALELLDPMKSEFGLAGSAVINAMRTAKALFD